MLPSEQIKKKEQQCDEWIGKYTVRRKIQRTDYRNA